MFIIIIIIFSCFLDYIELQKELENDGEEIKSDDSQVLEDTELSSSSTLRGVKRPSVAKGRRAPTLRSKGSVGPLVKSDDELTKQDEENKTSASPEVFGQLGSSSGGIDVLKVAIIFLTTFVSYIIF